MKSKLIDWTPSKFTAPGLACEYTGKALLNGHELSFEVWRDPGIPFPVWRYRFEGAGLCGKQGVYSGTASGAKRRAGMALCRLRDA